MGMKKFFLFAVFLVSLSFLISSAKAQDIFKVEWNLVEDGIIHKCYEIKIQNLDSVNHFFNLTAFFSNTNFPLEEMKNIMFYEWTTVPKDFPVYGNAWTGCDYAYYSNMTEFTLPSNCQWCNSTPQNPAYYKCLVNTVIGYETKNVADWSEAKMKVFKVLTTGELRGNSGNMNIPKYGSYEYDDFGNIVIENGTKKFKLCFDTPIVYQNDQWGSSGKVGIRDENGNYEEDPWWNSTWLRRKKIIINNTQNPNDLIDYQVAINLTYDSDMQPDFSDLRFTWYNSTDGTEIEIPYCLGKDCSKWNRTLELSTVDGQYTWVVIKIPKISAQGIETVYVYYGNTTPVTSKSDAIAVFDIYDEFNTFNTSYWEYGYISDVCCCYWTPQNGVLNFTNYAAGYDGIEYTSCYLKKRETFSPTQPIQVYWRFYIYFATPMYGGITYLAWSNSTTSSDAVFYERLHDPPYDAILKTYHRNDGASFTDVKLSGADSTSFHNYTVILNSTNYMIFQDTTQIYSATSNIPNDADDIFNKFYSRIDVSEWYGGRLRQYYIDFISVRKYTDPEPTYSIVKENQPPEITIFSPLNQSYYGSINFAFKATDDFDENFIIRAYLNNELNYENLYYQNNTQISYSKTLPMGTYNFTVYAEDSFGNSSQQEVIFTSLGYCGDNICQADYENNMNCFKDCGGTARQFTVGIGSIVLAFGGLMLLATAFASSPTEGKDYVFKIFIAVIGIILMVYGIIYLINL